MLLEASLSHKLIDSYNDSPSKPNKSKNLEKLSRNVSKNRKNVFRYLSLLNWFIKICFNFSNIFNRFIEEPSYHFLSLSSYLFHQDMSLLWDKYSLSFPSEAFLENSRVRKFRYPIKSIYGDSRLNIMCWCSHID